MAFSRPRRKPLRCQQKPTPSRWVLSNSRQRGGARRTSGLRQRGRDYVWPGREGSRRGAEAQRADTKVRCRRRRSVAPRCTHRYRYRYRYRTSIFDSLFPPPSSPRFIRSPYPLVRDYRTVERRRRRPPPLHGLHGETRLPGRHCECPLCTGDVQPVAPPLRVSASLREENRRLWLCVKIPLGTQPRLRRVGHRALRTPPPLRPGAFAPLR